MPRSRSRRNISVYLIGLVVLYWLAIFYATHMPPAKVPDSAGGYDKLLHFAAYAILALLLGLSVQAWRPLGWRGMGLLFLGIGLYAAFDEVTQIPVGRTADIQDWWMDLAGAILGLGLAMLLAKTYRKLTMPRQRSGPYVPRGVGAKRRAAQPKRNR